MTSEEIRVQVPSDRVSDFYRWFADWREGIPRPEPADARSEQVAKPIDVPMEAAPMSAEEWLAAATRWWRLLKSSERGVWGVWIEAAPEPVTADQIVQKLGLKGPRDIPGILSWVDRKGKKVGFPVNWRFEYDSVTGAPLYGLKDVAGLSAEEYADVLRRARAAVESK